MCPKAADLITTEWKNRGKNIYQLQSFIGRDYGQIWKGDGNIYIYSCFLNGSAIRTVKPTTKRFNYRYYVPIWEDMMNDQLEMTFRNDKRKRKK